MVGKPPVMLQAALVLFFVGLLDLLWSRNTVVAACVSAVVGIRVDIPHRNNGTPCPSTCPRSKQTSSCLSMPIQIASIMAGIQTWPYYVLVDQLSEPSTVERVSSFPQASQVGGGSELDDIRYAMAATSRRRRGGQRDSEEVERFGRHHPRPSVDQRHVYAKC